jgi:putative colanic acid biosynthesis acetyltransferase WcaF
MNKVKTSLTYKAKRLLWNYTWFFLFRPTPKNIGRHWRTLLLKLFGAKIHGSTLVCSSVRILEPWNLELGEHTTLGEYVIVYNFAKVTLQNNTVVSQYTELCTGSHDYLDKSMPLIYAPIVIEENAWVTSNCFIHPGVTIREGAVIGACSVVTKDMPAWMVCAGHPCKPLKKRVMREVGL